MTASGRSGIWASTPGLGLLFNNGLVEPWDKWMGSDGVGVFQVKCWDMETTTGRETGGKWEWELEL